MILLFVVAILTCGALFSAVHLHRAVRTAATTDGFVSNRRRQPLKRTTRAVAWAAVMRSRARSKVVDRDRDRLRSQLAAQIQARDEAEQRASRATASLVVLEVELSKARAEAEAFRNGDAVIALQREIDELRSELAIASAETEMVKSSRVLFTRSAWPDMPHAPNVGPRWRRIPQSR